MTKKVAAIILAVLLLSVASAVNIPKQVQGFLGWAQTSGVINDSDDLNDVCMMFRKAFKNSLENNGIFVKDLDYRGITLADPSSFDSALTMFFVLDGMPITSSQKADGSLVMTFTNKHLDPFAAIILVYDSDIASALGINVGDGCIMWGRK